MNIDRCIHKYFLNMTQKIQNYLNFPENYGFRRKFPGDAPVEKPVETVNNPLYTRPGDVENHPSPAHKQPFEDTKRAMSNNRTWLFCNWDYSVMVNSMVVTDW